MQRRRAHVRVAIADNRIEGIATSAATLEICEASGSVSRLVRQGSSDPRLRLAQRNRGRLRGLTRDPAADYAPMGEIGVDALRDLCSQRRHPGASRGQGRGRDAPAVAPLECRNAGPAGGGRCRLAGTTRRNPDQAGRTGAGAGAAYRRSALSGQSFLHRAGRRSGAHSRGAARGAGCRSDPGAGAGAGGDQEAKNSCSNPFTTCGASCWTQWDTPGSCSTLRSRT